MTNPELALQHLRWTAGKCRERDDDLFRARVMALLGVTYTHSPTLPRDARLLAAMKCYEQAAALYFAQSRRPEWARMQFNLGNACCDIAEASCPDKWEKAISHYEQALLFRTEEVDPHGFAATMENLGSAYRERKQGDKTSNVRNAIQCYRRAARVWRFDRAPDRWAALQNNLGNACLSLPATDQASEMSLARRAILHFDLALQARTLERNPVAYGITQLNRGQAFLRLGMTDSPVHLAESVEIFRKAHAVLLHAKSSAEASMALRGLDLAVQALNTLPSSATALGSAARHFRLPEVN